MIRSFKGIRPVVDESCYISESTDIIGNVTIGKDVNVWFGSRLRGDINRIVIGDCSNVQENSVIHVDVDSPTTIGKNVTIGHGAIIHGCTIDDNVLVGMGAIVLNDAHLTKNCIVGAGALVTQGKSFPEGSLIIGNPAKAVRALTPEEITHIQHSADEYVALSKLHLDS
jgi:carbonic anhydrase/acetyltransferase-like protein (isoleucine patch superfamily)